MTGTAPRERHQVTADEVELAVTVAGSGPPIVLVHGSLDDHRAWDRVARRLPASNLVVTYDRRGHGESTCPPGQGHISEDVDDLVAVLRALELADPPLVVGHSYGAIVTMLLGARYPELTGSLLVHEPPLFALLRDDPATVGLADEANGRLRRAAQLITAGDIHDGIRHFVDEAAFGPGTWDELFTPAMRQICIENAHTWLDQSRDPERLAVRPELLDTYPNSLTVSYGDASLPAYGPVMQKILDILPRARGHLVQGAGHAPHLSHPSEFASLIVACDRESRRGNARQAE